jgi:hypothetical protein
VKRDVLETTTIHTSPDKVVHERYRLAHGVVSIDTKGRWAAWANGGPEFITQQAKRQ